MGNGASNTTRFFERTNMRRQQKLANRSGLNMGMPKFNFRMEFLKNHANLANYSVPKRIVKWAPLTLIPAAFYMLEVEEQTQMEKLERVTEDLSRKEAEYANQVFMHWKAEAKLEKLQEIADKQRELERQLMQSSDPRVLMARKREKKPFSLSFGLGQL